MNNEKNCHCVDFCNGSCGYLYTPIKDNNGITIYPEMPKCTGIKNCVFKKCENNDVPNYYK